MECKNCKKQGLAILPVSYAVAPAEVARLLPGFPAGLGDGISDKKLKAARYILRALRPGYLYVLYPTPAGRKTRWVVYTVDPDGCLHYSDDPYSLAPSPPAQGLSDACRKQGDSIPAQTIAIENPSHTPHVWMAYSQYRWTKAVLRAMEQQPEPRMQKLDVAAARKGGSVKHGMPATAQNIASHIADYLPAAPRQQLQDKLPPALWHQLEKAGPAAGSPANAPQSTPTLLYKRSGQADGVAARLATIAKDSGGHSLIFALHDTLGITADLAALRNIAVASLAAWQSQDDRPRKLLVREIIQGMETSWQQQGKQAEWAKDYKKLYHATALDDDRKKYEQEVSRRNADIDLHGEDMATWGGSDALKRYLHDFDPRDDTSAKNRQEATALYLQGMGKTKAEQQLWDSWLQQPPNDPYAQLWGAVTGMNQQLGDYLLGKQLPDTGKVDKLKDLAKSLLDAHDEFKKWQAEHRAAPVASHITGSALASQLPRLAASSLPLYRKAGFIALSYIVTRTDILVTPHFTSVTQTQLRADLFQAVFGPPRSSPLQQQATSKQHSNQQVYVASIDGDIVLGQRSTSIERKLLLQYFTAEQAPPGQKLPPLALPAPPAERNPFAVAIRFSKALPAILTWVGLIVQSLNLSNTTRELQATDSDKVGADMRAGLAAGVLGVVGATLEVVALAITKLPTLVAKQLTFIGGVLGAVSLFAEAMQMWLKGGQQEQLGNAEGKNVYRASAGFFFGAGIVTLGAALASAYKAGALVGWLAWLAPLGKGAALLMPVWGWILLVAGLLVITVASTWQALKAEYNPLQTWLARCCYGTSDAKLRYQAQEEIKALHTILYAYRLEVAWEPAGWWGSLSGAAAQEPGAGWDTVRFALSLPQATPISKIQARLTLLPHHGAALQVLSETIQPLATAHGGLRDPHEPYLDIWRPNATRPHHLWLQPARLQPAAGGGYEYSGRLKLDPALYHSARLALHYLPAPLRQPARVLPAQQQQISIVQAPPATDPLPPSCRALRHCNQETTMWPRKKHLKALRAYGAVDRRFRRWQPLGPLSRRCGQPPDGNAMLYQLNSTTLEIGQELSSLKGMFALACLALFLIGTGTIIFAGWAFLQNGWSTDQSAVYYLVMIFSAAASPLLLLLSLGGLVVVINAFFGYTDTPIRFDRYHRKVWAFQPGVPGGVMTFDWDSLHAFTQSVMATPTAPANRISSVLLVDLDAEGEVRHDSKLPRILTIGPPRGGDSPSLGHYEYVRRFMEEGPQALPPCDYYLEPRVNFRFVVNVFGLLDYSRVEPVRFNIPWLFLITGGVLFTWFMLPFNLFGWLAYRVNRVPRWPQEIAQLAERGGPLQPPPGARSVVHPLSRREWPVVVLWLLSAAWVYHAIWQFFWR